MSHFYLVPFGAAFFVAHNLPWLLLPLLTDPAPSGALPRGSPLVPIHIALSVLVFYLSQELKNTVFLYVDTVCI